MIKIPILIKIIFYFWLFTNLFETASRIKGINEIGILSENW